MLNKTTIIVEAVELSREEERQLWNMTPVERQVKFGVANWNTSDGNNEIRFEGEDFYRAVIRPKARANKQLVVNELLEQQSESKLHSNLCIPIEGGKVEIVFNKTYNFWNVLVLGESRGVFSTLKAGIDFLQNSVNIFTS